LQEATEYRAPVIEIAAIIGIAGLAIGVANNLWSGRQQRKATEVTRSVGVDERFMELYDASREPEFQRMIAEVLYQYKWTDYNDFITKYGPETNVARALRSTLKASASWCKPRLSTLIRSHARAS
jgi:hypothetical protein